MPLETVTADIRSNLSDFGPRKFMDMRSALEEAKARINQWLDRSEESMQHLTTIIIKIEREVD